MIIVTNPILTRVDSLNKSVSAALNPTTPFLSGLGGLIDICSGRYVNRRT